MIASRPVDTLPSSASFAAPDRSRHRLLHDVPALGVASLLFGAPALAAPTVDGSAIVVPGDGWYQVQDATTYASLCEGVRRCEVGPGTFIVVNHTTGTRYEGVEVPGSAGGGAPSVSGHTISWADDGWYQVQASDTYVGLCQGGRSCDVEPGTYRVINLTTGTRFEGITVGTAPGDDDPLITFDAQERLLEEVFEIYSGEAWDTTPLSLPSSPSFGMLFEPPEMPAELSNGGTGLIFPALCRTGSGRIEFDPASSTTNYPWWARFDDCAPASEELGLELVDGQVRGDYNWHVSARSDELVWSTASGERVRFDGEIRRIPDESDTDDIASFVTAGANQIVRDGVDGALLRSIEEATSTRRIGGHFGRDTASLSGGFTYRSARTGGRAITVRIPIDLAYYWNSETPAPDGVAPQDLGELSLGYAQEGAGRTAEQQDAVQRARERWAFTTGTLELRAEDGSGLVLDANTGNLDTVRITLDEGRGDGAEERVIEWPGRWYRALAPDTLPSARAEAAPGPGPGPGPVDAEEFPARITPDMLVAYEPDAMPGLPPGTRPAGDVNGDGRQDAIVILRNDAPESPVSAGILFADASGGFPGLPPEPGAPFTGTIEPRDGFVIGGVLPDVTGVGDVNGDGYDDLSFSSDGFLEIGRGYVLAGGPDPQGVHAGRAANVDPARTLVEVGVTAGFTGAGDLNGDGIGDLFVTGPIDSFGGVIHGAVDLDETLADRTALRALALVGGCAGTYCSSRPVGDFDGDGFDDVYVSRYGGGGCGYASDTAVLYGSADGIAQRGQLGDYPAGDLTGIAAQGAGTCFPSSYAAVKDAGDGTHDLVIDSRFNDGPGTLVFGRSRRVPIVWADAFDGQRDARIDTDTVPTLDDVNGDGLSDLVFADGLIFPGRARSATSMDGPVVRRSPDAFEVRATSAAPAGTDDYLVSIDGRFAGTIDGGGQGTGQGLEIADTSGGAEVTITVQARDADGTALATTRRTVPSFSGLTLDARLVAPRLVELVVNERSRAFRSYGRFLVWRDGVPLGRPVTGAGNYFDEDLVLGRTYTYFVTPDTLPGGSLDPSPLANAPLVQQRSGTVTLTTPLP